MTAKIRNNQKASQASSIGLLLSLVVCFILAIVYTNGYILILVAPLFYVFSEVIFRFLTKPDVKAIRKASIESFIKEIRNRS